LLGALNTVKTRTTAVRIKDLSWQIGLVGAVLAAWQFNSLTNPAPHLPSLDRISTAYIRFLHGDILLDHVLPSIGRMSLGFLIGVAVGAAAGLVIGYVRWFEPWVRGVLEFGRSIPVIALLPGALLILGSTDLMRVSIIAFGCSFPVLLSAIDGARRVDSLLIETARITGLRSRAVLFKVVAPAALPQILAGVRIALGLALIMMVISEMMAADNGLGYYIQQSQRLFQSANVYAGVLIIGTLGFLFTATILAIESRLLRWHRGWRGAND
jgi:ABC-type nitrate/sulfonate/bicarbonate transport system permease component